MNNVFKEDGKKLETEDVEREVGRSALHREHVEPQILGAPRYSEGAALRGETDISSMKARLIGHLKYIQCTRREERN